MTDNVSQSLEDVVYQVELNYYLSLVAFAILYYDYTLTFTDEVRFFWSKKANFVAILFFLNRYLSVLGSVPVILQNFGDWSPKECFKLQKYHQGLSVVVQIIVGIILIVRTYALYERNLRIAIITILSALIVICVGTWAILGHVPTVTVPYDLSFTSGCHSVLSREAGLRLSGAWGGLLLFDSVIFTLLFYKAIKIWKLGARGLFHVLLRDGTIYYLVLAMANLSNIFTLVLGQPLVRGISTTFANTISVTMVTRLMLNLKNPLLRESYDGGDVYTTDTNIWPFVAAIHDYDASALTSLGSGTAVTEEYVDMFLLDDCPRNARGYDRARITGSMMETEARTQMEIDIEADIKSSHFVGPRDRDRK